ncbi:hypothetical protein SeMB42_g07988 [Synchytrium endobioticum]|uniref:Uncharacterized protein n=1 Tax=Synchytrium endobioticum TaxID=286115 RepID=A0A507CLM9_9FUNG|nr:hypothetical protein SeMB42_g07988 [Synchytrium endobioticum]TPX39494.1 hypothetical protein SeLEV6574_g07169 [Synchytrium endobioticum]
MSSNWDNKKDEPTANDNSNSISGWITDKASKSKDYIKSGIERAEETIQSGSDSISQGVEIAKTKISSRIHSADGKSNSGGTSETNVDYPRSVAGDSGVKTDEEVCAFLFDEFEAMYHHTISAFLRKIWPT